MSADDYNLSKYNELLLFQIVPVHNGHINPKSCILDQKIKAELGN